MISWILFHISIILLVLLSTLSKNKIYKFIAVSLICIILIYFSAFRNESGQDYMQYVTRLRYLTEVNLLNLIHEPLFNIIGYIVEKTRFSYLLLFLISAIVTNVGIVLFCEREKKYFPYMVLIFVLYPVLYKQSFNLVRQYFAIGLFYYSLKYIGVSLWRYLLCVTLAELMHFSAFLVIPLYWVLDRRFSKYWIVVMAIILILFTSSILGAVGQYERYETFVSSTQTMYLSGFTFIYNILLLVILFNNRLYKMISPIYLNLLILLVLFIDASYINYGYYRFACYFIPVIIYIIPYVFDKLWNREYVLFVVLALMVFFYFNFNNSILGKGLLPISELFDK